LNRSKFQVGNIWLASYFSVGTWLSNFCHSFSNPLGTFSLKMESLRKLKKVLRIGEEGVRKNSGRVKIQASGCHGPKSFRFILASSRLWS